MFCNISLSFFVFETGAVQEGPHARAGTRYKVTKCHLPVGEFASRTELGPSERARWNGGQGSAACDAAVFRAPGLRIGSCQNSEGVLCAPFGRSTACSLNVAYQYVRSCVLANRKPCRPTSGLRIKKEVVSDLVCIAITS